MIKPPHNKPQKGFVDILQEMDFSDNRTSAVVGAAFIENNLSLAIMARFRVLTSAEQKHIFENRGVLSDFASKIDIGFALNMYDSLVRDDLDNIRKIRNEFAHHLQVRDFDHPEVSGKCDALNARKYLDSLAKPQNQTTVTRKQIYLDTAAHLAARFDLETITEHRPPGGLHRVASDY